MLRERRGDRWHRYLDVQGDGSQVTDAVSVQVNLPRLPPTGPWGLHRAGPARGRPLVPTTVSAGERATQLARWLIGTHRQRPLDSRARRRAVPRSRTRAASTRVERGS